MSGAAGQNNEGGVWRRDEIQSPCQKICMIHPGARICIGCFRTPAEIGQWSALAPEERTRLMAELPSREARLRDPAARPSRRRRGASRS